MPEIRVGLAMTGSFCTFEKALDAFEALRDDYTLIPIMSPCAYETDTRFGRAADFRARFRALCGREILHTLPETEPIGPRHLCDVLVVAPCTGNTLAKLAHGVTDTAVTMACKSHLRNNRPLVLALGTNDGLSGSLGNLAVMLAKKHVMLLPFYQDDCVNKPNSLVSDYTRLRPAIEMALRGEQIQPILGKV